MNSALVPKIDGIWFQRHNYRILPLNPFLSEFVPKLRQAIERGAYVRPDSNRLSFYDIKLTDGWAYIHVRDDAKMIYVVAYIGSMVAPSMWA
jgi:hypothetical protein